LSVSFRHLAPSCAILPRILTAIIAPALVLGIFSLGILDYSKAVRRANDLMLSLVRVRIKVNFSFFFACFVFFGQKMAPSLSWVTLKTLVVVERLNCKDGINPVYELAIRPPAPYEM